MTLIPGCYIIYTMINSVGLRTCLDCGERRFGVGSTSSSVDTPTVSPVAAIAKPESKPLIHNGKFNLEAIFPQAQVVEDLEKLGIPDELANSAAKAILDLSLSDEERADPNESFDKFFHSYDSAERPYRFTHLRYVDGIDDITFYSLSDSLQFIPGAFDSENVTKSPERFQAMQEYILGSSIFGTARALNSELTSSQHRHKLELTTKLNRYVCDKLIEASEASNRHDLVEQLAKIKDSVIANQLSYNEPSAAIDESVEITE